MTEKLLTVDELAEALRITTAAVYGKVHKKEFPFAVRISRRCLRFSAVGLEKYLASLQDQDVVEIPKTKKSKSTIKNKKRGNVSDSYVDSIVDAAKKEVCK